MALHAGDRHAEQRRRLPRPVARSEEPGAGAACGVGRQPVPLCPDGGAQLVEVVGGDDRLLRQALLLYDGGGEGQILLGGAGPVLQIDCLLYTSRCV